MQNEILNREIALLKTQLRNAKYRYQLGIKDGAVNSVIKEVVERIHMIEKELTEKITANSRKLTNA